MTFLELVNEVLVRLREPEVTSVSAAKYSKLIGALCNDALQKVCDAEYWIALQNTVSFTTSSGTADYNLTGTNPRTTIEDVIDDTNRTVLTRSNSRDIIKLKQLETDNGRPTQWAIVGHDSSDQLTIRLYPTPDGARDYSVNCVIPDDKLLNGSDTFAAPAEPVYLHAYAMAIKERGEDQGGSYMEALDQYRRALARHMVLNRQARGGGQQWRVL